jgi:hypothetical protein
MAMPMCDSSRKAGKACSKTATAVHDNQAVHLGELQILPLPAHLA